jgi:hypothetical protein
MFGSKIKAQSSLFDIQSLLRKLDCNFFTIRLYQIMCFKIALINLTQRLTLVKSSGAFEIFSEFTV